MLCWFNLSFMDNSAFFKRIGTAFSRSMGVISSVLSKYNAQNVFGNLVAKYGATGLTDAEREANAYTAQREDTLYQRRVADMSAAGINPMMAVSNGIGSAQPSVSPSGGDISSLINAIGNLQLINAQRKNIEADTELKGSQKTKVESETQGQNLENSWFSSRQNLELILLGDQHERNAWEQELARMDADTRRRAQEYQAKQVDAYIEHLDKENELIDEQVKSEPVARALLRANAREANANADYKAAMQELDVKLTEAKTETEIEQLELLKLEARIKNGIYTDKTISAIAGQIKDSALITRYESEYKRGDYHSASKTLRKMFLSLEKDGQMGSWSFYNTSVNGAASANALPYK